MCAGGGPRRNHHETMFGPIPYPVTCLSIGNPHCMCYLMDEISKDLVCRRIGRYSESARQFPEKINTASMKVLDRTHIQTEVYERGAGYTLASGSGCCAAAAAAYPNVQGLRIPRCLCKCREAPWSWRLTEKVWSI